MLYLSHLIANASGKLNGTIFAHNRGGPYARVLTTPTNPNTTEQQACRDAMATIKAAWDALTTDQRNAWLAYSRSAPRTNRIGIPRPAGAWPEFYRANALRQQVNNLLAEAIPLVTTPPSAAADTDFGPLTLSIQNQTTGEILVDWDDGTQGWQPEANAGLLVYLGENRPLTVNFYASPYTLIGFVPGDNGLSDFTVFAPAAQLPIPNDRHLFWRARTIRADGRISHAQAGVLVT